jgi:hypothetical protein
MPGNVGELQRSEQQFIVFEDFEKLNTQSLRQALPETELAFLENLQPIAGNNLVTVPGPGVSITSIAENFTSFFYASINGIDYIIGFTSAGAGYAVNIATGVFNNFAPDGTFSAAPDVTTWQASRVLIADVTSGYSTFDGTLFIAQGGVSPVIVITNGGSGYGTPPSVTISGGNGTGATATSTVSGGSVIGVTLTNPGIGYKAADVLTVTFGTSAGSGATGHVTMSGFSVGSVTINNPGDFALPAPGTYALTITGGGGSGASYNAVVSSGGSFNFVSSVNFVAGGTGYTSSPSVTLSGVSGGADRAPVFTATLGTENVATIVLDTGGSGYGAPPNVTISGGLGAGGVAATAHSTISGGAVNALILDTVGSGYVSTPVVILGTGANAAATAKLWPFIPKPATLAVFQGRVWLGGGATPQLLQWTGTAGFDDFNPANASASLIISDTDLVHAITALRNYNNYLFIMGDQSVKQIGNISLNNAGNVTLFTILTLSSDQGTIYPRSCVSFNRVFLFVNSNGVYAVVGATVQKISDDLDGIFKLIDFTQSPNASVADINNIHNVVFLVRYQDPLALTRSVMLAFSGKKWFILSQGNGIACIANTANLKSGMATLYGSSGTDVTRLLADPTVAVKFQAQSSLTTHGNPIQRKRAIRAGFSALSPQATASTWTPSAALNVDGAGFQGFSVRQETLAITTGGSRLRVSFVAGVSAGTTTLHCSIAKCNSATPPNVDAPPIELLFGGQKGFVLGPSQSITSDFVNLATTAGDNLMVIMDVDGVTSNLRSNVAVSNAEAWTKTATQSYNQQNVAGFTAVPSTVYAVTEIDASVPTVNSVAMSIDTENGSQNYTMSLPSGFQSIGGAVDANGAKIGGSGKYLGMTITGTLPAGFTLTNMLLEYQEEALWR